MPRVLAISDMHGFLPDPEEVRADLLLIAGDVCPDFHTASFARYGNRPESFDRGEQRQKHWLDTTFREWLEAVREHTPEVVGIAGNHDFVFEHSFLIPDLPWVYLKDTLHEWKNPEDGSVIRIYGTPWVPKLKRWAFYASEEALKARAESIPDCDVLLSHGPPFGLCDRVVPKFGDCHVGDVPLLDAIGRVRPRYVVCGHIHEGYGEDYMEHEDRSTTTVVNVSRVDENYDEDNFRAPIELLDYTYPR